MPVSIPYDPSLVLGQVIDPAKFDALNAVTLAKKSVEEAETKLNSLVQAKLSLQSTLFLVKGLGVEVSHETATKIDQLSTAISKAAAALVSAKIDTYGPGGSLSTAQTNSDSIINTTHESPLNFERSQIKRLPLSYHSVIFDSQYFSFGINDQSAHNSIASIRSFVSASVSFLGAKRSSQFSASVAEQVANQRERHDVIGTLVITARATHEDAKIIRPMVLDVDKAIRIWNSANADTFKAGDLDEMMAILKAPPATETINLLSGVTLGSAFVGMIHVLRSESIDTSQRMRSVSFGLQTQMKRGGWFAYIQGGFGVNKSFSNDVKRLLSKQDISSHCTFVCIGVIPNIKSNQVQLGVKQFADFDPADMMQKLSSLANATTRKTSSLEASAEAARTGKRMVSIRGAEIQSVISSLGKIDHGLNQTLHISSLMIAFEDFVEKIAAGNVGVPIGFYVSTLTKSQLAQAWMEENFPDELSLLGDGAEEFTRSLETLPAAPGSVPRAAQLTANGPLVLNAAPELHTRSFESRPAALRSGDRAVPVTTAGPIAAPSIQADARPSPGDISEDAVEPSERVRSTSPEMSSALEGTRGERAFRPERSSMASTVTELSGIEPIETVPRSTWREERDKLTFSSLTEQSQDEGK